MYYHKVNRMKIKRIAAVVSALIIMLSLGACGETKKDVLPSSDSVSVEPAQSKTFTFEVVDANGSKTELSLVSDVKILGEALQNLGYIKGEQGPYGLYVKEVNGITADYNIDGTYWAFYINGELSINGVDRTEIVDGDVYSFRVEK